MTELTDLAARRKAAADAYRRLEAKRRNEDLKLVALSVDRLSTVIVGGAVLAPLFQHTEDDLLSSLGWFLSALILHCVARYLVRRIQSEE
jgi:hypothetical protein